VKELSYFDGIYIYQKPVDMKKSINGLSVIVEEEMGADLFGQTLFVFSNRRRNRLKMLYWDQTGFALWYKRLEAAQFPWPKNWQDEVIEMESHQLEWLLSGYDLWQIKGHKKLHYSQVC